MKTDRLSRLAVTIATLCLATAANAVTLNVGLTDSLAVGDVIHGIQAGGQTDRDVTMVNNLITLAPGATGSFLSDPGDTYMRSANVFGSLPVATATGAQGASGIGDGSTFLTIVLPSTFSYLVAAYDGSNGGVQVWAIGGRVSGTSIDI